MNIFAFSTDSAKSQIIVLNKMDLPESVEKAKIFKSAMPDEQIITISAATTKGIKKLKQILSEAVEKFHGNK